MDYLLYIHVFIWYAVGDKRLSAKAKELVESQHQRLISIASLWEMAIKVNIGRLEFKEPFDKTISHQFQVNNYSILNLELPHLFKLSRLELHHRDPFDRVIITQAIVEELPIVSADEAFDQYAITRIW